MKNFLLILTLFTLSLFIGNDEVMALDLQEGNLLKSPEHTSVYIYESGKRHAFPNSKIYYTWYENFDDVRTITVEEMENIELGLPVAVNPNKALIKFPLNPKVYSITEKGLLDSDGIATLRHLPNQKTAAFLYGDNWEAKIIELPEIYFLFYTIGRPLRSIDDQPLSSDSSRILTLEDVLIERGVLSKIDIFSQDFDDSYSKEIGLYTKDRKPIKSYYYCSDVCPDAGNISVVYSEIDDVESCSAIGGVPLWDAGFGHFVKCEIPEKWPDLNFSVLE